MLEVNQVNHLGCNPAWPLRFMAWLTSAEVNHRSINPLKCGG